MNSGDALESGSERRGIGADLYGEIWLAERQAEAARWSVRPWLPGLGIVAIAGAAAAWLADHYAMPIILAGLLIGLALNFLAANPRLHPGMDLCSTAGLRWGIVLLGTQVTLAQIAGLGAASFAALIAIVALVIAAGVLGARLSGNSALVGLLAGGATAICGASAALAIYALIAPAPPANTGALPGAAPSSAATRSTGPATRSAPSVSISGGGMRPTFQPSTGAPSAAMRRCWIA
ncbi:putative sulfate exporter family transporter [Sphingopyxis sp.]|uniref:putative sulfate exporter family transporter n=1 Tax=Sphingopyxis sp. TaxID=1908224 RepID=UPI003F71E61A